jgi:HSP20 family protein
MPTREPRLWMWAEACELLDRAERLQRQFFQPARGAATWAPPVDIFETPSAFFIVAALPGVAAEEAEVRLEPAAIVIAGERRIPIETRGARLHRLEIPHGRFERRVELPPGRYELGQRELAHGCLVLSLHKLS